MNCIIKECETRVRRTYRGGALLDVFLGRQRGTDGFFPEDWISSFVEAKNRDYIPGEGITRLEDGRLITDAVGGGMFGQGRTEPGVLIKLLDSGERLGIQVHPTDAYAKKLFGSDYGKTESWHVLSTRRINDEEPKVYLGFKPGLTRELWTEYYRTQNVNAMLNALHEIPVKPGDTILVAGGTPHAIGGGCMLLEIQQPSDYTGTDPLWRRRAGDARLLFLYADDQGGAGTELYSAAARLDRRWMGAPGSYYLC